MSIAPQLADLVATAFAVRSTEPVWKWAARNVYIKERGEYWDPHLTPWVIRALEIGPTRACREIHWMKSSRTGVSEAAFHLIRWKPRHAPGDVLYTIDSQDEVRNISKTRLRETILANAGEALPTDPHDVTSLAIRLKNMNIYLGGGASESIYNNKAIDLGIVDEPETQKLNQRGTNTGGSTIDLTRSRFTTVENPLLWTMSKPHLEGGIIHEEWKLGTREIYLVPCPHCGVLQELTPSKLVFSHCKTLAGEWDYSRLARETFIKCEACGELVEEKHKRDMVQCQELGGAARWLWTNPHPRPAVFSFHISDLYSLFPQVGWGRLAEHIIRAAGTAEKKKYVRNNHFGLPWKPHTVDVDESALMLCRAGVPDTRKRAPGEPEPIPVPTYKLGPSGIADHCPIVPAFLTLCADVQGDRLKGTLCAFQIDGTAWLLGYFSVLSLDDLPELCRRPFPVLPAGPGAPPATVLTGLVDSGDGNRTYEIYEWIQSRPEINLWPSKGGRDLTGGRFVNPAKFTHKGRPLVRYDYHDHQLKCLLYHTKIGERKSPRLYFPTDLADHPKFWTEFQNEKLVIESDKWGRPVQRWKQTGPNDWPDSLKMHYVIWDQLAPNLPPPAEN